MATTQNPVPSDHEKRVYAWQYYGYPALSKWMASSNDAFLLRKFGAVSARSLLYLQDQIAQKEKELDGLDAWTMSHPPGKGGCGSFALDEQTARGKALREITALLERYRKTLACIARGAVVFDKSQIVWRMLLLRFRPAHLQAITSFGT